METDIAVTITSDNLRSYRAIIVKEISYIIGWNQIWLNKEESQRHRNNTVITLTLTHVWFLVPTMRVYFFVRVCVSVSVSVSVCGWVCVSVCVSLSVCLSVCLCDCGCLGFFVWLCFFVCQFMVINYVGPLKYALDRKI